MPEIKNIRELGPITGALPNRQLNVNLSSYSNKYDENFRPDYTQEYHRASNQSGLEQLGYGLLSRTLSIVPKIGNGLGALYGATFEGGYNDVNKIWDNPLNEFFNGLDESLKETFPVYQSRKNAESGLLGKMATTSFWANDGFDGIAFALSAAIPGIGIGKGLNAAGSALQASNNIISKGLVKGLRAVGMNSQRANLLVSTAYNTLSESAVEAYQTQHEIEELLISQGTNPQEAKQKAAAAAARTFRANMGVLAVPNFIENTLFHGGWDSIQKATRKGIWENGGKAGAEMAGLDSAWSKIGKGVLTEGLWEENVQTSLQQYERMAAKYGDENKPYVTEIAKNMANNTVGFVKSFLPGDESPDEIEGAVSIFLGGLIGGGMGAYSYAKDKARYKDTVKQEEDRYNTLFKEIAPAAAGLFRENVTSVYTKDGKKTIKVGETDTEVNNYKFDDNGRPILDPKALHNMTINQLREKHLWDAHMLAAYRNDPALAEVNKQMALSSYAYGLMTNKHDYTTEEIDTLLNNMSEVGDAEAKELGLDTYIKDNVAKVKEYVRSFKEIAAKQGSAKVDINNPLKSKFNDFLTKSIFYQQAKLNALVELSNQATTEEGKMTIARLMEDTTGSIEYMQTQRDAIEKQYKETIFDAQQSIVEYKKLADKRNRTSEEETRYKQLGYMIRESNSINGNWAATGSSRTLPMGAQIMDFTNVTPGSRDMYQKELGKTTLALDHIEQDLSNPQGNILQAALDLRDKVTVRTQENSDRIDALRAPVIEKIDNESVRLNETIQGINTALQVANDLQDITQLEEGEEPLLVDYIAGNYGFGQGASTLEELMADPDIEALVTLLSDASIEVDETTIFNEDFVAANIEALKDFSNSLQETAMGAARNIEELTRLKDDLQSDSGINRASKRLTDFANAANPESYLKKDFYDANVKNPAEQLIEEFKEDERTGAGEFTSEVEFEILKGALESAIVAYENRQDGNTPTTYVLDDAKEKLDYMLNTMYPKMIANLNRRAEIHRVTNNDLTGSILNALGLINSSNANVRSILEKVLGKDKLAEVITKVYAGNEILSFDGVNVILESYKALASEEQIEDLQSALLDVRKQISEKFLNTLPQDLARTKANLLRTRGFELRPYFNTTALITAYFEEMPEIVQKFLYDKDLHSLAKLARNDKKLNEEERNFLVGIQESAEGVIAVNMALEALESEGLNYEEYIRIKDDIKEDETPSLQQNIVLNQSLRFLYTKTKANNYENWLLVQGIGGSGKTFLIAKTLLAVQGQLARKNPNVLAFSKEKLTTDNINKALFDATNDSSLTSFLSKNVDELKDLDILILDEVFTFNNTEIALINAKVGEVYAAHKKVIKVIALGDPSQTTAEESSVLSSALATKFTIPLTTSYRTNVSSIAVFNRRFQLKPNQVLNNVALANVKPEDVVTAPGTAYGVVALTVEQLESALKNPSPRSRVLIVNSEIEKINNTNKFPGVVVKMIPEAQGYQWDEVYTLLDPVNLGADNFTINRNLYTANSRAKNLLAIAGDPTVINAEPNNNMDTIIEQANTELATARAMFHTNLKGGITASQVLKGTPAFTNEEIAPEILTDDNGPKVESNVVNAPNYAETLDPEVPIPVAPEQSTDPNFHYFSYPTNYGLNPMSNGRGTMLHNVTKNAIGHVVRVVSANGDEQFAVFTESAWSPGNYVVLAVLGETDFNGSAGEYFNSLTKVSAEGIDRVGVNFTGFTALPNIERISLGKIIVQDHQRFKTEVDIDYANEGRELLPGTKDVVEDAIVKFYLTYYGPTANGAVVTQTNDPSKRWVNVSNVNGVDYYTVNWDNVGEAAKMVIPTRSSKPKEGAFGWDPQLYNPAGLSIIYGVPYLVIFPSITNSKKPAKPLLIKFQPQRFNRQSHYYQSIRSMYEAIRTIESITDLTLGTEEFAETVRDYAHANFIVDTEPSQLRNGESRHFIRAKDEITPVTDYFEGLDSEQEVKITEAMNALVLSLYGAKNATRYFKTEEEAKEYMESNGTPFENTVYRVIKGKLIVGVAPTADNRNLWTLQVSNDPQDRENNTSAFKEYILWEGEGPAQEALNSLAQANASVGMEQYQLRETIKAQEDRRTFKILRAPSVLMSEPYTDYDLLFQDEAVRELLGDDSYNGRFKSYNDLLTKLADKLVQSGQATEDAARKQAISMVDAYTTVPVTTNFLDLIVGDNSFNSNGGHDLGDTYLRLPLRLHTLNNTGINDLGKDLKSESNRNMLNSMLRHNFLGFRTT